MLFEKLTYSQFDNEAAEWKFDECKFGRINLIVGKNATGKTRTLNVLRGLAALLSDVDVLQWSEGNYRAEFKNNNELYNYVLEYHNRRVSFEELKIDGEPKLTRMEDGTGKLYAEREGRKIEFQTEVNRIAASAKRDAIQHSYLDKLYQWAKGTTRYNFNTKLGKDRMLLKLGEISKLDVETKINIKDTEKAIDIFMMGKKQFAHQYEQAVLDDMNYLEYDITEVGVGAIEGITFSESIQIPDMPFGLYVQETDLQIKTRQNEMSDGMFRALSVLIQVNYALLSGQATCLLIDDIGEGLDFSRSSALVKRLVEKAEGSSIQLIMATNDRFIMNAVPLEYWIVLVRKGGHVKNLNYSSAKEIFGEFEKTGLNNFDFFSSGYYLREE